MRVFSRGKYISDRPSGRSLCHCTDIMFFQNPQYMASRQLMILRIADAGTSFSPLPCQAWHGYMVTSAHRVEVEVGTDGPPSAPLSGAAAAAPPPGAAYIQLSNLKLKLFTTCTGSNRLIGSGIRWIVIFRRVVA
jgi:hypothetical protein